MIELDSGKIGNFIGYRVQHDNARGPFVCGRAIITTVDQDEAPVARELDDLEDRLGRFAKRSAGAKGGINCDPKQAFPAARWSRSTRKFIEEDSRYDRLLHKDIPAPDMGTDACR